MFPINTLDLVGLQTSLVLMGNRFLPPAAPAIILKTSMDLFFFLDITDLLMTSERNARSNSGFANENLEVLSA